MKDTIRVLAIAPYEGLAHLLKLIGNQYDMLHLDIFVGDLEQGLTIARSHFPADMMLSSPEAGTADRIRCIITASGSLIFLSRFMIFCDIEAG